MNRKKKIKKTVSHTWGGDRSGLGKPVGRSSLPEKEKRLQVGIYMDQQTEEEIIEVFGSLKEYGHFIDGVDMKSFKKAFE